MRKYRDRNRGAALWLTVLVTLVILTFFVGAVLSNAKSQTGLTNDELGEMQAHYAALGAINEAFILLEANPDWTGSWEYRQMPQNPDVFHSLTADRTLTFLGPSEIHLEAQGFTATRGPGTPLAAVAGTAYRPEGGVRHAFFADKLLFLRDCVVDAYDSSLGIGYRAAPSGTVSPTATPSPSATPGGSLLFSSVPGASPIGGNEELFLENTTIDGKVVLPQAGLVSNTGRTYGSGAVLNNSGSTILGTLRQRAQIDLPPIGVPFATGTATSVIDSTNMSTLLPDPFEPGGYILPPGAYKSVTVPDGGKLAFKAGDYYFEDGFFAQASSATPIKLRLSSENSLTKLFVGGQLRLANVNFRPVDSGDPTASPSVPAPATIVEPGPLRIYGAGLEQQSAPVDEEMLCQISMENTNLSAIIVGEAVEATLTDCEIWGAVMGRSVQADRVRIHYDTKLADILLAEHARWRLRGLTRTLQPTSSPTGPGPRPPGPPGPGVF